MMGQALPCGKCLACLIARRRIWTHRIMLESHQYEDNTFATLTYGDDLLPKTPDGLPTLSPSHLQTFMKKLRWHLEDRRKQLKLNQPHRIRFYAVGEYGDETWRPHYHVALFNFKTCARGRTRRRPGSLRPIWSGCCAACDLVGSTWGFGDVDLGILEASSAQYVAGYVTKKLTHGNSTILAGRHPEFARMSNRPGIGGDALWEIADAWMRFNLETKQPDVPSALRHGKKIWPLGRYLTRRLRKLTGRDEKTPPEVLKAIAEEMRPLQEAAFDASKSFSDALMEARKQSTLNLQSRTRIYKGRKVL